MCFFLLCILRRVRLVTLDLYLDYFQPNTYQLRSVYSKQLKPWNVVLEEVIFIKIYLFNGKTIS